MYGSLLNIKNALGTDLEQKVIINKFEHLEIVSIDYGIMEKTDDIFVIPDSFGWDDLGSWRHLRE